MVEKEKMKIIKEHWKCILLLLFAILVTFLLTESHIKQQPTHPLINYWRCMDGCYEMLEVIFENVTQEHKHLHSECALRCAELYKVDEYMIESFG